MTGKWFGLGSILTAFGTSVCCLGPLVFSLLGLSSATSLAIQFSLVPYRNWFLTLSGLLVGAAFYLTYSRGRPRRRLDEALLWVSTAITVGLLFYTIGAEGL